MKEKNLRRRLDENSSSTSTTEAPTSEEGEEEEEEESFISIFIPWLINAFIDSATTVITVNASVFLFAGNLGFANMVSLIQFPQERFLFNRERQNGLYGTAVWFAAKQTSDFLFQIMPSMLGFIPWFFMMGFQNTWSGFFGSWFAIFATLLFIISMNYVISASSARMEHAISIAPVYMVIQFVLVGFFIPYSGMEDWYAWFRHLSCFRYGFYGILTANFNDGYIGILPASVSHVVASTEVLNYWYWPGVAIAFALAFRIVAFVILCTMHRNVGCQS